MKYIATVGEKEFLIEITDEQHVILDGVRYEVDFQTPGDQPVFSLLVDGKSFDAYVYESDENWEVLLHGDLYAVSVVDERERRLRAASGGQVSERGEFQVRAPMPGLVIDVAVGEGQQVKKGDVLIILESMKMQNELRAPRDGQISQIRTRTGDSVEQKQILLSIE